MVSFITGIIASLTPCTIVLIPILLYRFGLTDDSKEKMRVKEIGLLLFGFLGSLLLTGFFLQYISQGPLINVIRYTLSIVFIVIGVLQFFGKVSFASIKTITHPLLLGFVLPWTLSLSPCVLPYLSVFIASGALSGQAIVQLLLFGAGLITPALIFALLGEKVLRYARNFTRFLSATERYASLLIVATGVFIGLQAFEITILELTISSALLLIMLFGAGYLVFVKNRRVNIQTVLIFLSLLLIWGTITFHCKSHIPENSSLPGEHYLSCDQRETCEECRRCAILFGIAAGMGTIGYLGTGVKIRIKRG